MIEAKKHTISLTSWNCSTFNRTLLAVDRCARPRAAREPDDAFNCVGRLGREADDDVDALSRGEGVGRARINLERWTNVGVAQEDAQRRNSH